MIDTDWRPLQLQQATNAHLLSIRNRIDNAKVEPMTCDEQMSEYHEIILILLESMNVNFEMTPDQVLMKLISASAEWTLSVEFIGELKQSQLHGAIRFMLQP